MENDITKVRLGVIVYLYINTYKGTQRLMSKILCDKGKVFEIQIYGTTKPYLVVLVPKKAIKGYSYV